MPAGVRKRLSNSGFEEAPRLGELRQAVLTARTVVDLSADEATSISVQPCPHALRRRYSQCVGDARTQRPAEAERIRTT